MKYKVIVYAISKNEEKFVSRWYNSMKEADSIYVLDTGSTDNTVSKLRDLGVIVKEEVINPWRFDVARNKSLDMVPLDTDICVCTDLDEVLEPGWREKLEKSWESNTTRMRYKYNWSLDEKNKPLVSFIYEKIHSRDNYKWIYPVHEILKCSKEEVISTNLDIVLNHYPDSKKSRSSYLPLLELSIKENPESDRNMHYLGREYMYYKEYKKAIKVLKKHLSMPSSTWKQERCASMRFIARCYIGLGNNNLALKWYKKATLESVDTREPFVELAYLYYIEKDYINSILNLIKAKTIYENNLSYINEPFCYDSTIDDLLSINYYNLGLKDEAIFYVDKAISLDPTNIRLKNNKEIFLN